MPSSKRERQKQGRQSRIAAAEAARRRAQARRRIIGVFILVALVLAAAGAWSVATGDDDEDVTAGDSSTTSAAGGDAPPRAEPVPDGKTIQGDTPCPAADGSEERASSFAKAPPMCIDPAKSYTATFETSDGEVVVALDDDAAPGTVNNFVVLSRYHYYDGSAIHRTDPSIDIIQGGSPSSQDASDPGPGYTIKDEGDASKRTYKEGDLVMARSQGENSGGAQYFFVAGPKASALDAQGTYVTFGKVTEGLDVVKAILGMHQADPTSQLGGAPSEVVVVEKVTITEK